MPEFIVPPYIRTELKQCGLVNQKTDCTSAMPLLAEELSPTEHVVIENDISYYVYASSPRSIDNYGHALQLQHQNDESKLVWKKNPIADREWSDLADQARQSWEGQFKYLKEIVDQGVIVQNGLRAPQIGAIHAVLAHWTVSNKSATVIMPTGTGKTETMLCLLAAQQINRLLVIVPTDPLRQQVANKFISFGILKQNGILSASTQYPVVGILKKRPLTVAELDEFCLSCNVVVSTMALISGLSDELLRRMADHFSHLFIDEAHHVAAPKWEACKSCFEGKPVVQYTATPFRNDGKLIDEQFIYNYPLRKAQEEGYFKKIQFVPVHSFSTAQAVDKEIAKRSVSLLRANLRKGFDHIMMARALSIKRAEEIYQIYLRQYNKYNPIMIHSGLTSAERKERLAQVISGESKIVICVDMLGEGFDLPELKVAALHDMHKSLGVTLQFIGRFTRTTHNVGDASVVANIADPQVSTALKNLYSEDADWNILLQQISTDKIKMEQDFANLLKDFSSSDIAKIPLQNLKPKMSCVAYETTAEQWNPDGVRQAFSKNENLVELINEHQNMLVLIRKNVLAVQWGHLKDFLEVTYDLYLVYWNPQKRILYINSTADGFHGELANALLNNQASVISVERPFRCFSGINRLVLNNVGLRDALRGPVRYRMFAGMDVGEGLSSVQMQNRIKSNFFGVGFENGTKTSIGCSYKGRIWARKDGNLSEWKSWCDSIGEKLLNDNINIDNILKGILKPERITERPNVLPFMIEWADEFYQDSYNNIYAEFGSVKIPLYEIEISLSEGNNTQGPIRFQVEGGNQIVEYEFQIAPSSTGQNYFYRLVHGVNINLTKGNRTKSLLQWFEEFEPIIWFVDGSFVANDVHVKLPDVRFTEDILNSQKDRITGWNWDGTDITIESQRKTKIANSIQRKVIETLFGDDKIDIIFDDDSAGEAADVITIKFEKARSVIHVEFYHCKFSSKPFPGARIEELYVVCGQAQKSIRWKERFDRLVNHMISREKNWNTTGHSRFERGDLRKLIEIRNMSQFYDYELSMHIVQPGLSKTLVSQGQLELLCVTESYLKDTYNIPLQIIGSH